MNAEIQEFLSKMKKIQTNLLQFIDNSDNVEENFQNFIQIIDDQISQNPQELKLLLRLINVISNNHHRTPDFFTKFEKILTHFKTQIIQNYSNFQIFHIFKKNRRILLFLIEENFLKIDKTIATYISKENRELLYIDYFSTELKPFNSILYLVDEYSIINNRKRRIGENDEDIAEIIRNDQLSEFIEYVTKNKLNLNSNIESSVYETNLYLIEKEPSLIEYASFFGSFQIFEYLYQNNVQLSPTLWNFAVHGNNLKIISFLKEKNVGPEYELFEFTLNEALKCHHNEVAEYIRQNLVPDYDLEIMDDSFDYQNCLLIYYFRYCNFVFCPDNFVNNKFTFFYACQYDYYQMVEILLKTQKIDLNSTVISNKIIFF